MYTHQINRTVRALGSMAIILSSLALLRITDPFTLAQAQQELEVKTQAQYSATCAGYLYGAATSAAEPTKGQLLEYSTLLATVSLVLAQDSGETEAELRTFTEFGMTSGSRATSTEEARASKQKTIENCSYTARDLQKQVGQDN